MAVFSQSCRAWVVIQVKKHVISVLGDILPPSLLYTNQVLMFLHSTARSADILNPGI